MDTNINDFIDFPALFKSLFHEHKETMEEVVGDVDDPTYKDILAFKNSTDDWTLDSEECEYSDSEIVFSFSLSDNNANESDAQGSGANCTITYSVTMEDFADCTVDNF